MYANTILHIIYMEDYVACNTFFKQGKTESLGPKYELYSHMYPVVCQPKKTAVGSYLGWWRCSVLDHCQLLLW